MRDSKATRRHGAAGPIPGQTYQPKKIWRPSHFLRSNGGAKYVLGIGMVPKLLNGRMHRLAKSHRILQTKNGH